jgi:peroxiredoxin
MGNSSRQIVKNNWFNSLLSSTFLLKLSLSLGFFLGLGLLIGLTFMAPLSSSASDWHPAKGQELLGTPAPEFRGLSWVQGGPLTLAQLRGKPVLIRFWLAGCPLCENSAEALNYLDQKYGPSGLVVIGIHHPKSEAVKSAAVVQEAAQKLGFKFAIAQDNGWQTINAIWLRDAKRKFTSATLLLDKNGRICWLHDGGILHMEGEDSAAFASLNTKIVSVLENTEKLRK